MKAEEAPKTYKDLLNPRWRNKMSCKISASGLQFVQWYTLRKLYGAGFWKEFAKQNPHAFDSRVQLFDRLAKGDDDMTARWPNTRPMCSTKKRAAPHCLCRAARRPGGDAADCRRRQQGAASGSCKTVRRLGDVAARPGLVPEQSEPLLRLGAQGFTPDAGPGASDCKLISPKDWTLRQEREVQQGMERDAAPTDQHQTHSLATAQNAGL